jgi:hypothetical protein
MEGTRAEAIKILQDARHILKGHWVRNTWHRRTYQSREGGVSIEVDEFCVMGAIDKAGGVSIEDIEVRGNEYAARILKNNPCLRKALSHGFDIGEEELSAVANPDDLELLDADHRVSQCIDYNDNRSKNEEDILERLEKAEKYLSPLEDPHAS